MEEMMAEKKTNDERISRNAERISDNADRIAELEAQVSALLGNNEKTESPAKKPAAKKPAAKKPASKSSAAKAPAKKPTTKKPATKAAPKKAEEAPTDEVAEKPAEEEPVVQPVAEEPAPAAQEPIEQPAEEKVEEQPAEDEKKAEQPAPVAVEEKAEEPAPVVEEKVEQPVAVEQKAEQPAPAPTQARGKKSDAFMNKTGNFINNKGKLPLFIVANSILFLSFLFLLIGAFSISTAYGKSISGNLFTYYGNGDVIKLYWQATAGEWANGGYVMMGILMTFACLVPLALVIKNIIFFFVTKDKNVHMLDAIVTFAFLIAYLGVVNMYGANMTWAHLIVLIMSIVLLAYTIFVILLENREGPFPFFSIANLILVMLCMFLLTSNKIYASAGWYAAHAAAFSGGGGFAFIMLLVGLAALVLLVIMQVKKLPGKIAWLFEFVVPAVAGVCALIALISFAAGKPDGLSMGGGFVFGAILTLLFAAADVVFALVPKLHKFNVKVTDRMSAAKPAPAVIQPVAQPAAVENTPAETEATSAPAENTASAATATETPADNGGKLKCPACGMENEAGDVFCMRCGRKLK